MKSESVADIAPEQAADIIGIRTLWELAALLDWTEATAT